MKKKFTLVLISLLCGLLLLAGCGKAEESTVSEEPTYQTSSAEVDNGNNGDNVEIVENVEDVESVESVESADNAEDAESSENDEPVENTVSFGLGDTVKHDELCEMSGLYAEVLDDDAVAQGWHYYYTDSDESPARILNWELSDDNYTTLEVLFTVKNISGEPQIFGDKITAQMLYMENEDSQIDYFVGTVFQQNPGQVDESGEMIMWSTKPVAIEADESANVSFRFDIPKDVYEKIYAAAIGEDNGIRETCEFSFGDGTTYVINLAEALILASQYEG